MSGRWLRSNPPATREANRPPSVERTGPMPSGTEHWCSARFAGEGRRRILNADEPDLFDSRCIRVRRKPARSSAARGRSGAESARTWQEGRAVAPGHARSGRARRQRRSLHRVESRPGEAAPRSGARPADRDGCAPRASLASAPVLALADRRLRGINHLVAGQFLRDLPDVAVGIREAGGAHSPGPVDRAVEQYNLARSEGVAYRVCVVHPDRELHA
jgi:hypothetical protein